MLIIPAIDLKGGKCVRLAQGKMDQSTIYADNPVAMAQHWAAAGARRLHSIDLDGATSGAPLNASIIHEIVKVCPDIVIQVGGGIRNEDTIQSYLDAGVNYVIIGTRAITAPHFVSDVCLEFPGHIILGLDVREGKLAIDGWSKLSHQSAVDVARRFEDDGVAAIIFTDISRDGMLNSPNVDATVELCQHVTVPVIASGGVKNLDDVRELCQVADEGIYGVITGKAIYEKTLDLAEAQQLADTLCNQHS